MTDYPIRVQFSRKKGWRMPPNTVSVARPGRYGNPFRERELTWIAVALGFTGDRAGRTACAIELFRRWRGLDERYGLLLGSGIEVLAINIHSIMHGGTLTVPPLPDLTPLRGRNLGCWCGLCPAHADGKPFGVECPECAPCHADVLLELANAPHQDAA